MWLRSRLAGAWGSPPLCALVTAVDTASSRRPTTPAVPPARRPARSMRAAERITVISFIACTDRGQRARQRRSALVRAAGVAVGHHREEPDRQRQQLLGTVHALA